MQLVFEPDDATESLFTKAELFVSLPGGSDAADIRSKPNSCLPVLLCK